MPSNISKAKSADAWYDDSDLDENEKAMVGQEASSFEIENAFIYLFKFAI